MDKLPVMLPQNYIYCLVNKISQSEMGRGTLVSSLRQNLFVLFRTLLNPSSLVFLRTQTSVQFIVQERMVHSIEKTLSKYNLGAESLGALTNPLGKQKNHPVQFQCKEV